MFSALKGLGKGGRLKKELSRPIFRPRLADKVLGLKARV